MRRREFVLQSLRHCLAAAFAGRAAGPKTAYAAPGSPRFAGRAATHPIQTFAAARTPPARASQGWSVPANAVDVRQFGARGDGRNDDRPAIAAALAAVHNQGGGAIWLPHGTYLLQSFSLPDQQAFFNLPADVSIYGPGTVKVAPGFGAWKAMFSQASAGQPLKGCTYAGFQIDHNSQNNPYPAPPAKDTDTRVGLLLLSGNGVSIRNVSQLNLLSRQAIMSFNVDNLLISNCKFLNAGVGDSGYDFDSSLLYLDGDRYQVENCTFIRSGMGGRTAIELHGRNFLCSGNLILNFTTGIIVASGTRFNRFDNGEITHNRLVVREGIALWPCNGPINHLSIHHNTITLNRGLAYTVDARTHSLSKEAAAGIDWAGSQPGPVSQLYITYNTIQFINENRSYGTWNGAYGIQLDPGTLTATLSQLVISHNRILNAPGEAIRLANLDLNGVWMQRNLMVNPESGTPAANSGAVISLENSGTCANVHIVGNVALATKPLAALKTFVQAPADVQVNNNTIRRPHAGT